MITIDVKKLGTADVIVDIVPKGNPEIRPAYAMKPQYITIHNTGNAGRGADAEAHNKYIHNMAGKQPKDTSHVSWHFTVDDKKIYQHLPLNESAWHCGDGGNGTGNRKSIGIEICENPETDTHKAEENAIALAVYLMKKLGIPAGNVVPHQHWSGKYCPRVILKRDGGFGKFRNRVQGAYSKATAPVPKPATTTYTVERGDTLWGISKRTGVPVSEIKHINGLKSDLIRVGQVLRLSKTAPAPKPTPKPAPKPSYIGKRVEAKVDLRFYNKPSWADKDVVGVCKAGLGFTIVDKVKVGSGEQYKVKNSKGTIYYITASSKYVRVE